MNCDPSLKAAIADYCQAIGADPMLVQGAGGNVSWKDGHTLWIKASGTWLADAGKSDIFVPADLSYLQQAIRDGNFYAAPVLHEASPLRASIETMLHALMPHRVVVHLHAIEVLARLVRTDFEKEIKSLIKSSLIHYGCVDYQKPGALLAEAVNKVVRQNPDTNVIFLKNHGVVIGGDSVQEVDQILRYLTRALESSPQSFVHENALKNPISIDSKIVYLPIQDNEVHNLSIQTNLFKYLDSAWALYPDHVVFLGHKACTYQNLQELYEDVAQNHSLPELVFVHQVGVFTQNNFSIAKQVQLRCYYDVLVRQHENVSINCLTESQIGELLNWESERYRISLAK